MDIDLIKHELAEHAEMASFFSSDIRQMISRYSLVISLSAYTLLRSDVYFTKYFLNILELLAATSIIHGYFTQVLFKREHLIARAWFEIIAAMVFSVSELLNYLLLSMVGDKVGKYIQLEEWNVYMLLLYAVVLVFYLAAVRLMRSGMKSPRLNRLGEVFKGQ